MVATIFEQLSKGKTIEDAVSKAKEKHGNFDPYLTTEQVNNLGIFEQAWYYLGLYNINDIITPAEIVLNGNNTSFKLITLEQIKGQVIDSNTKLPVSGVKISCDKIGVSCTTDEMGKFSLIFLFQIHNMNLFFRAMDITTLLLCLAIILN